MENNDISSFSETKIENGFVVLRTKNDSDILVSKKKDVNKDVIQFHFCLKGQTNFIFNQGNYTFQVQENHSMLLYNPQKPLPINVELTPETWMISILISIAKFHSLFSSDANHISFLSPENSSKKYYDNLPFTSSIAVVLSQILQARVHDSMKSLYFKGKIYELLSLYFNKNDDSSIEQCPFLIDEQNVQKIRNAKDIILDRMIDPPSLDALALEIGLPLN